MTFVNAVSAPGEGRVDGPAVFPPGKGIFVASRKERIEQARSDWRAGRFPTIPGDDDFIPLPT
ncbi:MAG: hypothetical protein U5K76_15435 [Woeseiaceae bacterium]|nr:hypothetical protein [Woeseiaceae bacterium]